MDEERASDRYELTDMREVRPPPVALLIVSRISSTILSVLSRQYRADRRRTAEEAKGLGPVVVSEVLDRTTGECAWELRGPANHGFDLLRELIKHDLEHLSVSEFEAKFPLNQTPSERDAVSAQFRQDFRHLTEAEFKEKYPPMQ